MTHVLPLTVLVHEGPMASAYLAAMRLAGYKPERIVQMVYDHDVATGKPLLKWLPPPVKMSQAEILQNAQQHFWVREIKKTEAALFEQMSNTIAPALGVSVEIFDELLQRKEYSEYADDVQKVMVSGLKAPELAEALKAFSPTTVLFTGGGIVPASLLAIEGLKFIHIHPGYLPWVRGGDGLLWSTLVRKCPGATSFYMDPGIDTGQIIHAAELPAVTFPLAADKRPDDQTLYRALFAYFDPLVRATVLTQTLNNLKDQLQDMMHLPSHAQLPSEGNTYHFMHPAMRKKALEKLFPVS